MTDCISSLHFAGCIGNSSQILAPLAVTVFREVDNVHAEVEGPEETEGCEELEDAPNKSSSPEAGIPGADFPSTARHTALPDLLLNLTRKERNKFCQAEQFVIISVI